MVSLRISVRLLALLSVSRSVLTALLMLITPYLQAQMACASPGRHGQSLSGGVVNSYFTGADNSHIAAGSRTLPITLQRGDVPLFPGDMALLMQVQGSGVMATANQPRYGDYAQVPLAQEWVRIERVNQGAVSIKGAGEQEGTLFDYHNAPASDGQNARRWQLVRVPQFNQLTLEQDLAPLPWDGRTGGVLALDVRRHIQLNGYALDASASGFRGGQAISLLGALGRPSDWRYAAPNADDAAQGYGHHGSKGEGIAGAPLALSSFAGGYPGGDHARGAPATAGGGGNGLDLSHRRLANGGGGGNGAAGLSGEPSEGGGQGGRMAPPGLVLGGGGGAAARTQGEGGSGGAGGGVLVVRAAGIQGAGVLSVTGANGEQGPTAGGGAGAGGTVWLDVPEWPQAAMIKLQGGEGAQGGGNGGHGQRFWRQHSIDGGAQQLDVPGIEAGYRCRPAGFWVSGLVFEDNGGPQGQGAFNGRKDRGETYFSDWPIWVEGEGVPVSPITTSQQGGFHVRLAEADTHQQPIRVTVPLNQHWHPVAVPHGGQRIAWQQSAQETRASNTEQKIERAIQWHFTARPDQHAGPLMLGVVTQPDWQAPAPQQLEAGATAVLVFTYRASVAGTVRFSTDHRAVRGLLIDRLCSGDSEQWQSDKHVSETVRVGETVCLRVPVFFDGAALSLPITATTLPLDAPLGFSLPAQTANAVIRAQ